MIYTLYKTTNVKNKKIYVGVHSTEDVFFGTDKWKDPYVGSGNLIWKALKKYGRENFIVEILGYFPDSESAYKAEGDLITENWLVLNKKKVYNITLGGKIPPKNGTLPPTQSGTKWINNGKYNKRVSKNVVLDGWMDGRLFQFSDEEIERRRDRLTKRNIENNPMSNNIIKMKMTQTVKDQYKNGRKSHNARS